MNLYEKLVSIQAELKAPKSNFNKFGNYYHRSLEDILEAIKPLLLKNKVFLKIDNEVVEIMGILFRKSTGTIYDCESDAVISTSTMTQEVTHQKGMSPCQASGATASYSDKYCLGKLFLLDDTKDPDATNSHNIGDTVMTIGKNKGKTFDKIGVKDLSNLRDFLERSAQEKGEPLSGQGKLMVEKIKEYMNK